MHDKGQPMCLTFASGQHLVLADVQDSCARPAWNLVLYLANRGNTVTEDEQQVLPRSGDGEVGRSIACGGASISSSGDGCACEDQLPSIHVGAMSHAGHLGQDDPVDRVNTAPLNWETGSRGNQPGGGHNDRPWSTTQQIWGCPDLHSVLDCGLRACYHHLQGTED